MAKRLGRESLSTREASVLAAIQFSAREPTSELQRLTGLAPHTLSYILDRLRKREIITPYAFVDCSALGFTSYHLFCTLSSPDPKVERGFEVFLTKHNFVSDVRRVGGDFHYRISILARSTDELRYLLDGMLVRFGDIVFDKVMVIRAEAWLFPRKHLTEKAPLLSPIHIGICGNKAELDHLDARILHALGRDGAVPSTHLARKLRTPNSTVEYRLKRLEREEVVKGWVYSISPSELGLTEFRLLISVRRADPMTLQNLMQWAESSRYVFALTRCLGSWDFEAGIEVDNDRIVSAVVQELYEKFGATIQTVKVVPVYQELKRSLFPFDPQEFAGGGR